MTTIKCEMALIVYTCIITYYFCSEIKSMLQIIIMIYWLMYFFAI